MLDDTQASSSCAYNVSQARERLGGISRAFFYALVKSGRLKITKLGCRTVVTEEQIKQCLASAQDETSAGRTRPAEL